MAGVFPGGNYFFNGAGTSPSSGGFSYAPDFEHRAQMANDSSNLLKTLQQKNQEATLGAATQTHGIDTGAATERFGQGLQAETARRGQDQQFALGNRQADITSEGNQLQYKAALAPIDWSKQKFGQIFPLVQNALNGFTANGGRVGGQNTPQPAVTTGGVYSDGQIQQNVNAARAGVDQQAATDSRAAAAKLAGQGFGGRSPLLAAIQGQIAGQAMGTGADQERQIRSNAAEANSKQNLASQQLAEQQWQDFNTADIQRRQAAANQTSSLLAALANFT